VNLLLDTCSLIWALQEPEKLSAKARKALEDTKNPIFVSAISFWEISLKASIGKLSVENAEPEDFPGFVQDQGWETLSLSAVVAASYAKLPRIDSHKDPFDRMLIHTAILRQFHLVSSDRHLPKYRPYGLQICW
jgi:PIN domain nuclease of toxin-antitoxin system